MKNKFTARFLPGCLTCSIISFLFSSCVWKYVTPTHNTPCFTGEKQFEVDCSGNINGGNLNLAYSPLNYLSVQLNAFSSLSSPKNTIFNNQLEAAVGGYLPTRRFILGITAGYGIGATNWKKIWDSGEVYTPLEGLQFDTRKYYADCYGAYKWKSNPSFSGVSAKVNFMENYYHKAFYSIGDDHTNFKERQYSYELIYFMKLNIIKTLYFNISWGLHYAPGSSNFDADIHPLGQVGLTIKI